MRHGRLAGATVSECVRMLKAAGTARVCVLTVVRG